MTIPIASLDFQGIKGNLKEFLKGQSKFKDYNFSGSAINTLLDLLSFNTQYLAYYMNMSLNESFLDSATLRTSVVSLAKHLGYLPHSKVSSTCLVNVQATSELAEETLVTLPRGTLFTATFSGTAFKFYTTVEYVAPVTGGYVVWENVEIKEGELIAYSYQVDATDENQKFTIPSPSVDISTVRVIVQDSLFNPQQELFTQFDDIYLLSSTSPIYFIQETSEEYEIYFGDGILGKKPSNGNLVIIEYVVTNGSIANGIPAFDLSVTSNTQSPIKCTFGTVTKNSVSFGGADAEDVDSIKFRAPINYETQNRVITTTDYENKIRELYTNVQCVKAWGGEDMNPKQYGKIFVSVKPYGSLYFPEYYQNQLSTQLLTKYKSPGGFEVLFVQPEYTYINLTVDVKYKYKKTNKTEASLRTQILQAANEYFYGISVFDKTFNESTFLGVISDSDQAIDSVTILNMQLMKVIENPVIQTIRFNTDISAMSISNHTIDSTSKKIYNLDGAEVAHYETGIVDGVGGTVSEIYWTTSEVETVVIGVIPFYNNYTSTKTNIILQGSLALGFGKV